MIRDEWGMSGEGLPSSRAAARPYDIHLAFYFLDLDQEHVIENTEAALQEIIALAERLDGPAAVAGNNVPPADGFAATLLQRVPLCEVTRHMAMIRIEAEEIADRHQVPYWLYSSPSPTPIE